MLSPGAVVLIGLSKGNFRNAKVFWERSLDFRQKKACLSFRMPPGICVFALKGYFFPHPCAMGMLQACELLWVGNAWFKFGKTHALIAMRTKNV
jgi:hypothetical protein